ncbi:MAG: S1C family serine protease [Mycoplasmatales bacterium]
MKKDNINNEEEQINTKTKIKNEEAKEEMNLDNIELKQKEEVVKKRKIDTKSFLSGILGFLIAFALIIVVYFGINAFNGDSTVLPSSNNTNTSTLNANSIYENNVNGVVTVINYQKTQTLENLLNGTEATLKESGSGSGFIYKKEKGYYYALTNQHVIDNGDDIRVLLPNSEMTKENLVSTEVLGSDSTYDVAVIRFKTNKDLTVLKTISNDDDIVVGDTVYALGSPYGTDFQGSITEGIVSAPLRTFDSGGNTYTYVQTDTAINPGNSGGPLINSSGEVIGINAMKIADTTSDNMGFAIPINEALKVANFLEK